MTPVGGSRTRAESVPDQPSATHELVFASSQRRAAKALEAEVELGGT